MISCGRPTAETDYCLREAKAEEGSTNRKFTLSGCPSNREVQDVRSHAEHFKLSEVSVRGSGRLNEVRRKLADAESAGAQASATPELEQLRKTLSTKKSRVEAKRFPAGCTEVSESGRTARTPGQCWPYTVIDHWQTMPADVARDEVKDVIF